VIAWTLALPLTYEVIDRFDVDGSWVPARWPIVVMCVVVVVGLIADVVPRRASALRGST
jgi:hypothetical protein